MSHYQNYYFLSLNSYYFIFLCVSFVSLKSQNFSVNFKSLSFIDSFHHLFSFNINSRFSKNSTTHKNFCELNEDQPILSFNLY